MPNRIIKESIRTSKSVNALSDFQFRVWVYFLTYVDDYGRGSADPELLKGIVFTRRKGVTESQIKKAIDDLANMGMVNLYEADGELYFYFPNWSKHQRIQTKQSKFPEPQNDIPRCPTVSHGDPPPESNPIQYNPNPNPNTNPNLCTEPEVSASVQQDAVIFLTLNDKSEYPIYQKQVDEWKELYPAVDVMQQLRGMKDWLNSNPSRRKTKNGILRFISGWLSKEQDRGGSRKQTPQEQKSSNPFLERLKQMEGMADD